MDKELKFLEICELVTSMQVMENFILSKSTKLEDLDLYEYIKDYVLSDNNNMTASEYNFTILDLIFGHILGVDDIEIRSDIKRNINTINAAGTDHLFIKTVIILNNVNMLKSILFPNNELNPLLDDDLKHPKYFFDCMNDEFNDKLNKYDYLSYYRIVKLSIKYYSVPCFYYLINKLFEYTPTQEDAKNINNHYDIYGVLFIRVFIDVINVDISFIGKSDIVRYLISMLKKYNMLHILKGVSINRVLLSMLSNNRVDLQWLITERVKLFSKNNDNLDSNNKIIMKRHNMGHTPIDYVLWNILYGPKNNNKKYFNLPKLFQECVYDDYDNRTSVSNQESISKIVIPKQYKFVTSYPAKCIFELYSKHSTNQYGLEDTIDSYIHYHQKDKEYWTPFIDKKYSLTLMKMVITYISQTQRVVCSREELLIMAIRSGCIDSVKYILSAILGDVKDFDKFIILSILAGNYEIVEYLINYGSNINIDNPSIFEAALISPINRKDIIYLLCANDCVIIEDHFFYYLRILLHDNHDELIVYLIKRYYSESIVNIDNINDIMGLFSYAIMSDNIRLLSIFLAVGLHKYRDKHIRDLSNQNILFYAAEYNKNLLFQRIFTHFDTNAYILLSEKDNNDDTIITILIKHHNVDLLEYIIENHINDLINYDFRDAATIIKNINKDSKIVSVFKHMISEIQNKKEAIQVIDV